MNFEDKFKNTEEVEFVNLPTTHSKLNGKKAIIINREFRGWSKWFYNIDGFSEWFQEGCFKQSINDL